MLARSRFVVDVGCCITIRIRLMRGDPGSWLLVDAAPEQGDLCVSGSSTRAKPAPRVGRPFGCACDVADTTAAGVVVVVRDRLVAGMWLRGCGQASARTGQRSNGLGGEDLVHLRGHQGVDDVQGTRLGEAVGERAPLGDSECLGGAGLPGQALLPGCFEQVGTVGRRRRCAARAAATAGNPLSYRRHGTEACRQPAEPPQQGQPDHPVTIPPRPHDTTDSPDPPTRSAARLGLLFRLDA
jgi:hypothetical protein